MVTFAEARKTVEQEIGPTLKEGLEDDLDWNVFPESLELDDLVILVSKSTGKVHLESHWDLEDRRDSWTHVADK